MNNIKYTLKVFMRSLNRKKTISVITISGYAISMAVIFILITFIIEEKSVNKSFPNAEHIYRIKRAEKEASVPQTLLLDVKGKVPGVEKMCLYSISRALYKFEGKKEPARFIATNDDFLQMFSFDFIYQSGNPTLSTNDNILLTRQFSEKLFGSKNPVGEVLEIKNNIYKIVGVVHNPPANSSFKFDVLTSLEMAVSKSTTASNQEERHTLFNSFVLVNPHGDSGDINSKISGMLGHWQAFKGQKLSLQPFNQVYFDTELDDGLDHANVDMIYLLSCIAIILLFMTVFNYVNLTISRSYERLNEIGIKRTSGAGKSEIFNQFITESMATSILSMAIAIVITFLISPLFSDILGKKLDIALLLTQPRILLSGTLIFFSIGIISGIYPALVVSGISPIQVINRQKILKRGNSRARIIAIQFLITSVLLTSLLFIDKQMEFIKNKDLGFDHEMMIRVDLDENSAPKWEVLKNKLLANPLIVSVTASHGTPFLINRTPGGSIGDAGDKEVEVVQEIDADEDFISTFGLTILKGRDIESSDDNVCLINENLYNYLEWKDFNGKKVFGSRVIGVVKDFHHLDIHRKIEHFQLKKITNRVSAMSIKISGNTPQTIKFIQQTFNEIGPQAPLNWYFYDDWLQTMYQKEERQAYAIKLFTVLAIIISCLGLIGLAENITNKKIKEIGIRKINGSKISEILVLLNKDFLEWVLAAFIVSTPITYYTMQKWLESFAYKTELSWWIFALAGLLALGIALLTVSWQSWKAATRNPVEALRYE
jgi:putative ABC transport system permease protein